AMGLGAPYLVLGTFSGLIQRLPRSGDWMVWVERVFGAILFGVGLNYALIALAPKLAAWVLPAALVVGGLWLGFLLKSGSPEAGFARVQEDRGRARDRGRRVPRADRAAPGAGVRAARERGDSRARGAPGLRDRFLGRLVPAVSRARTRDVHRRERDECDARVQ